MIQNYFLTLRTNKNCYYEKVVLIITIIFFVSCNKSPEDKANELIKQELRKSLYKPDTYQVVETKVDSAFAPMDSPEIFTDFHEFSKLSEAERNNKFKMELQESSMAIWSGPYQSEYGKIEYKQAKRKYDEAKAELNNNLYKSFKITLELGDKLCAKKKFIGWKVRHNYRAENNARQTLIGDQVFIIDKSFTKILYSCEADEYDVLQKGFKERIEQIQETKQKYDSYGITREDILHKVDSLIANGHTMMEIYEKGLGSF